MAEIRAVMATAPAPKAQNVEQGAFRSAVLAGLYQELSEEHSGELSEDGPAQVVLTRRSQRLRSHSGEVSFPGGRQEPGEDLWVTALREAEEEIALDRTAVAHLGELDHLRTVSSRSWIVPYVAEIADPHLVIPQLRAAPAEVELVLHVGLDELLKDGVFREELWTFGEYTRPVFFFEIEGDTVWGATAAMLRNLLSIITGTHDSNAEISHWDAPDAVLPLAFDRDSSPIPTD
ncbi:MAG: CoA pyrophosphatase [Actinomycetes bacterium]